MSDDRPIISVCLPTYNGTEHLASCIASIRSQSFMNFEVVICDDQSSDGTLDLARELAEGDDRFRFISNPSRLGLVANWNNCISESRGEWIKFVFQDDIIAPSCLEKLLEACRRSGKPFSFSDRDFIFGEDIPDSQRQWFAQHQKGLRAAYCASPVITPEQVIRFALKDPSHNPVGEPTVALINKSVFQHIGVFDEALIQLCDAEFWRRIMINYGAVFVPESLAQFRVHTSATTNFNRNKRAFRGQVLDPVVIWYRTAFSPHFKPLRNPKITGRPNIFLAMECAVRAWEALWQAKTTPAASQDPPGSMIAEWNAVRAHCPGLQLLAWVGLANKIRRKLQAAILPKPKTC